MAGGGASVEVGRITVKVTPDTKGFARKLRQDLARLRDNFEVDVAPDAKGFREKVKAATSGMTAKVKVDADVDRLKENFQREFDLLDLNFDRKVKDFLGVDKLQKEFDKLDLNWDKKIADFQRELRQTRVDLQPQVLKDKSEIVSLRVELDQSIAEAKLAAWRAQESNNALTVALDPDPRFAKFEAARAKIKAIFSKKITQEIDVDKDSVSRIRGIMDKLDFSKLKPNFGSGINLAGYAVILGAIVAVAGPLVGLVTSALLALPGLVAAVATPIAAITLGLDGIKRAAGVLKEPFDQLREKMSAVNETAFTPVFEKLREIFPTLERAMPAVSNGLAQVAASIVSTITSASGMAKIEDTIRNIGTSLTAAAPGFAGFTDGLLGLADELSKKLPGLSEWINNTGKSFSDWVAKVSADGSLSTAFDGLGSSLKTIMDVLGQVANAGFEFMQDPKRIELFNTALRATGAILTWIVNMSTTMFDIGVSAITTIIQVVGQLMATWNSLKGFLANIWAGVVETAVSVWTTVSSTVSGVISGIASFFTNIPGQLSAAWSGLVGIASSAWQAVVSAVSSAWESMKAAVQAGIEAVVSFMSSLPGRIASAVGNLGSTLVAAGKSLMDGLLNGIKAGLNAVLDFASGIAAKIAAVKGPLPKDRKELIPAGLALMEGLGVGLENGFQPVLDQAKGMAQQIADAFENGGDPTGFLAGYSKQDVKLMTSALGVQMKQLEQQAKALDYKASNTTDKGLQESLRNRAKEIRQQKDQIELQNTMLKMTQDYNSELDTGKNYNEEIGKSVGKLMGAPVDFSKAVGGQFLSDLGIGGNGFISKLISEGTKYVFNVGSMDDAIAGQRVMQNRELLGRTQR